MESRVTRKIALRILPILILCYFIAIIDRANIGVAALTMNADLGITAAAFGFAAGIFFVPYVLLEVPSNLALAKVGANWWIARIMVTWGIVGGLHAFVWDAPSLYVVRALMGAAEAGFFPGVIFYLTLWIPAAHRGRMIALFTAGIPIALMIGTPASGLLLNLDGWLGLAGWQWVFVIEAIPAIGVGLALPFILPSTPDKAKFLTTEERTWLVDTLAREKAAREASAGPKKKLWKILLSPQILVFALVYYGLTNLNGAISTFLPQILAPFGLGNTATTFIAAIPYAFGLVGMIVMGRIADRPGKRAFANYLALSISVLGLVASATIDDPLLKVIALCLTAFGVFGIMPVFWGLPTALLTGAAAAGGIALINALGNLSSVVNPAIIGVIRERSGDFNGGLLWLAAMGVVSMITLTFALKKWPLSAATAVTEPAEATAPAGKAPLK